MDFITLPQTTKKIFIQDNFVSMFKSLLSLPVFIQRNNESFKPFIRHDYMGYKRVMIMGSSLNLQMDFKLFIFIYIRALKAIANGETEISWNIKEYYEYADGRDEITGKLNNQSNHNKATIEKKKQSLLKISTFSMMLEDSLNRTNIFSFINTVEISENNKEYKANVSKEFMNFFKIDSNAIYNLNMEFFNSLKQEYARRVYLSILCHSANEKNTLSIDKIADSFRIDEKEELDKKFMLNVRNGVKELEDKKFLVNTKEEKDCNKITTGWSYMTNLKARPERVHYSMLPEVKEKKVKQVKTVKEFIVAKQAEELDTDLSGFDKEVDMSIFEPEYTPYSSTPSSNCLDSFKSSFINEQDELEKEMEELRKWQN